MVRTPTDPVSGPLAETVDFGGANRRLTPMLRQYLEAKAACPANAILMFRMGDFFELFFDDAKIAARELDLTLTARDKGDDPIPMAGVPHHAVSSYIARLVERGYSVALCDQVEDPRKAKGIVKREITRLITPGTMADLDALDPGVANYLGCVAATETEGRVAVALLDLLAGELLCTRCDIEALGDELRRMGVRELIVPESLEIAARQAVGDGNVAMRPLVATGISDGVADPTAAAQLLCERFGGAAIAGVDELDASAEQQALAWVIRYAESTQRRPLKHLMAPRAYRMNDFLVLDETTRRNLELTHTQMENRRKGALLWHLDRCRTAMGSRFLAQWLAFPLRDLGAIERRLDAVQCLKDNRRTRESVQEALDGVRDVERLIGRVAVGIATPRDLAALRGSLAGLPALQAQLGELAIPLGLRWRSLDVAADLGDILLRALVDEPPITSYDGGIFRHGFCPDLDELLTLSTEGHGFLADLEKRERQRTGITNLKVRYNRVFGYYLEVTNANLGQVPPDYVRKQTLVGAERFITAELKAFEDKVLYADERRKEREAAMFAELVATVGKGGARLRAIGRLVAETDALASLAQVADEGRYCRPTLCQEAVLELEEARHPVLERLMPGGERFVPNDVTLSHDVRQLVIVTGPNMAGKSTVMRQTALCALLAHMGSFVPAKRARVGLCDRLFTRVGASDNLGRGHSTFMVEMIETATILRCATAQSLVILDEIGRGTSTYDGVSIAWAVAEHLHDAVGCRAMFATHYHELTDLALERPRIVNASVAVKEHNDSVVFLRRLVDGAANRSYGIQVARLANLPESVLVRAREILANLESGELDERGMPKLSRSKRAAAKAAQLNLFVPHASRQSVAPLPAPPPARSVVEEELGRLDLLNMTPLMAIAALERLQMMVQKKTGG